jgi:PAS domain S-box-containing protein
VARTRAPIDLLTTMENVNVPSFVIDRNGIVRWLNKAGRRAFGNVAGKESTIIVAPEYVPLVEKQLQRKLRGVPVTDYNIDVFTTDGRRQPVEVSSVPIRGGDSCHAIFGIVKPRPLGQATAPSSVDLTPRQHEVLQLLAQGASTDSIAAMLHLSKETVRNHVRNILRALGAHSRLEGVAIAYRRGLLPTR